MESSTAPPIIGISGYLDAPAGVEAVDDVAPVVPPNGLDELAAELNAEAVVEERTLDVPARPGYAVRYRCDATYAEVKAWRAKSPGGKGMIDELRLSALVLANKSVAILRRGDEVELAGEPATFRSPAFLATLGVDGAADAVVKLYGLDGHVIAAAGEVLSVSGFGAELGEADDDDPTRAARRR